MKNIGPLVCLAAGVILSSLNLQATPYASGVTNQSGNGTSGGTIQFILNEPADNVYVIFGDGSSNAIASPGTTGVHSFALGSQTKFAIYCVKAGSGAVTQISSDTNPLNATAYQRGVAVSRNAQDWRFGRVYLSRAYAGGIFCRNADQSDVFGQGSTTPRTAGLPLINSTYSPWRLFVGPDETLYIGSTSTSAGGGFLARTDGDVLTGGLALTGAYAPPYAAGENHMQIMGTPCVTGSIGAGNLNLYAFDVYYNATGDGGNNLLQWNVGSGPFPSSVTPNVIAAAGLAGNFIVSDSFVNTTYCYVTEYRLNPASPGTPCLQIYTPTGTLVWDSFDNSIQSQYDLFTNTIGVSVSPDGQYLATMTGNGVALVCKLISGIPDETTIQQVPGTVAGASYGSVCWDAADNLYGVNSGSAILRVYSLGLTTTCVTSNDYTGTNGAFQLALPNVSATVVASTPQAYQANNSYKGNGATPTPAVFTITLNAAQSAPIPVKFTLGGTATNGVQYNAGTNGVNLAPASSYIVVFPAGVTTENVTITPTATPAVGPNYSVLLTLQGGVSYSAVIPDTATAYIANSGPQSIGITSVQFPSMYRGISNDFAAFIISRYGDTNAAAYSIPTNAFVYAGTAIPGHDYSPITSPITVNPGDLTEAPAVSAPVATGVYHGNETILVSLSANGGIPIAAGSLTASMTLVDNADPPAPVLWSDPLTNALDSVNWTLTFANSNLSAVTVPPVIFPNYPNFTTSNPDPNPVDDFDVEFGFGITNDAVGASPAMLLNGWTNALKMTVNKISGYAPTTSGGCSAGVNVYPNGMKFSGNYAFRFSMNLAEGTVSTTEYNIFGINHRGTNCNWFAEDIVAPIGTAGSYETNQDGIWYWIDADNNGIGAYGFVQVYGPPIPNATFNLYTNLAATGAPYTNWFKSPVPYNCFVPGVPSSGAGNPANTWADVEVKQVNGLVTMSVNKFPIITYNNATNANSGDIMLGYDDPYASIGSWVVPFMYPGAAVYYSNARVVQLTPPNVTGTAVVGTTLTIKFTDSDTDDTAASFELLASNTPKGTYAPVAATFSQSTSGAWQAAVAVPGSGDKFYQVVRIN